MEASSIYIRILRSPLLFLRQVRQRLFSQKRREPITVCEFAAMCIGEIIRGAKISEAGEEL